MRRRPRRGRSREEERAIHAYYGMLGAGARTAFPRPTLLKAANIILRTRSEEPYSDFIWQEGQLTPEAKKRLGRDAWMRKRIEIIDPKISTKEPIAEASLRRVGPEGRKVYVAWFGGVGQFGPRRDMPGALPLSQKQLLMALREFARQNPDIDTLYGDRSYDPEKVTKRIRRQLQRTWDPHLGEQAVHKRQEINLARMRERRRGKK